MTDKSEQMNKPCCCPYCDAEIAKAALPCCQVCGVEVFYCPKCQEAMSPTERYCPNCGADIREEVARGEG